LCCGGHWHATCSFQRWGMLSERISMLASCVVGLENCSTSALAVAAERSATASVNPEKVKTG